MSAGVNERRNKQLLLKKVPEGISGPDDFEVRETQVPGLQEGQVLVESHYVGVDAALPDFFFRAIFAMPNHQQRGVSTNRVSAS